MLAGLTAVLTIIWPRSRSLRVKRFWAPQRFADCLQGGDALKARLESTARAEGAGLLALCEGRL